MIHMVIRLQNNFRPKTDWIVFNKGSFLNDLALVPAGLERLFFLVLGFFALVGRDDFLLGDLAIIFSYGESGSGTHGKNCPSPQNGEGQLLILLLLERHLGEYGPAFQEFKCHGKLVVFLK